MKYTKVSLKKLKAILLYFSNNTNTKYLGKVKLMKLFYFLDFLHVKRYGSPVTYDTYVHLEHGPIPSFIKNIIDSACDEPEASLIKDVIRFETPNHTKMKRLIPLKEFSEKDRKYFTQTELDIMKEVCKKFSNTKTEDIEALSHKEAPWNKTNYLEEIPYSLAALDEDSKVSPDEIDLLLNL